ncbi:ABC transporter ATP-binding protein [Clostridiaceae bacterium 35-E11]
MTDHVVCMKNITKRFGGNIANNDVTLNLKKGTIHGLLGENGAGKTTLMNILYGLNQPDEGEMYIKEKKVQINSPSRAIELGIGMVHQHFMLVRPFSVVENIVLGLESERKPFLDIKSAAKKIEDLCEKYKMKIDPHAKIWQLSVGEQQRVEILSAIYCGADILILDEPTAVLTPQEVEELFEILRMMREDGKSIIFITHKLEEILEIGDEISVLRDGKLIDTVNVSQTNKDELTTMMVGREVLFNFSKSDEEPGDIVLKVDNLHATNAKGLPALRGITFEMRSNEILGIAGVDGNGQKELCEVLTGIKPMVQGNIKVCDETLNHKSPREYIKSGISHIPEDRHRTGLVMDFSVMKNFILKEFDTSRFSKYGFLKTNVMKETAQRLIKEYRIKTNGIMAKAKDLSGGNQQKIILSREIGCDPKVIIANQPTRGLDIGAMEYVRQRLLDQKKKGVGILLISADLEEIFQLADRVAVIYEGKIMGIMDRDEIDLNTIGLMMAGVQRRVGA